MWRFELLKKNEIYVWSSHFPEIITSNMQIGNDLFVLKYRVTCNQKFQKTIFIEINVKFCHLCAHHVMTYIFFHTRWPNFNQMSVTQLVFMFQLIFIFRILRSWKARFSHRCILFNEVCTKEYQVLGGQ